MADSASTTRLRGLVDGARDGALLRMSLANALLADGNPDEALAQVRRALQFDADYSAAWKLLGRLLTERSDNVAAADAYRAGIAVAEKRGDKQALKEMQVFLRRLQKIAPG